MLVVLPIRIYTIRRHPYNDIGCITNSVLLLILKLWLLLGRFGVVFGTLAFGSIGRGVRIMSTYIF